MQQTVDNKNLSLQDFRTFSEIIYRQSGIHLGEDKHTLMQSRLQKRVRAIGCATYAEYLEHIQGHDPDGVEMQNMINRVTTNKTHFFFFFFHFDYLRDVTFPSLIEQAKKGERKKQLRIWSAACSSGEEPYSIAMMIDECFSHLHGWDIRILATDIDTIILDEARAGIFHEQCVESIDPQRIRRYFLKGSGDNGDKVQIRQNLRDLVTFKQVNFAEPSWPINAKFDAIFCRNVLIYFDDETQDQLVRRFVNFMHPNAHFFIGHSESLNRTADIYKRCGNTVFQLTDAVRQQLASNAKPQPPQNESALNSLPVNRPNSSVHTKPVPLNRSSHPSATATSAANKNETTVDVFASTKQKPIIIGEVCTSEEPVIITTTIGSCIAACLYDPISCVGGMNHFALPEDPGSSRLKTNFGVHSMELLINSLLDLGAARHRLRAKVFGAGEVSKNLSKVGKQNEKFIRHFLSIENIPLEAELLGGECGMTVYFEPTSARVRVHLLEPQDAIKHDHHLATMQAPTPDITLF